MAHTFTNLLVHLIFSTKDRYPYLTPEVRRKLFPYMDGIVTNSGGVSLCTNGPDDHGAHAGEHADDDRAGRSAANGQGQRFQMDS